MNLILGGLVEPLLITGGFGGYPLAGSLTLREAVRAWLAGQSSITSIAGGIYFAKPSQVAAYPCLLIRLDDRKYGHNLAGADGTSVATVEVAALGLVESQCIALVEAVRDVADGFRGTQSGVPIVSCLLDDESDPLPVPPPDGSDNAIYQATVNYRIKHRVPAPTGVTQTNPRRRSIRGP